MTAANEDQQALELSAAAERSDPPAKSRRSMIPDWLRFGEHESVPLPAMSSSDSITAEAAAGPGADFQ